MLIPCGNSLEIESTNNLVEKPIVETFSATSITGKSATFSGKLIYDGGEPCQLRFKYHRYRNFVNGNQYTQWTDASYMTGDEYSTDVNDLSSGYWEIWLIAKNSAGETIGNRQTFIAKELPPDQPDIPIIPDYGVPGKIFPFFCYVNDPEGANVYYQFRFYGKVDDGTYQENISKDYGKFPSNRNERVDVLIPNEFVIDQHIEIKVRAKDSAGASLYSFPAYMYLTNPPINLEINGPREFEVREEQKFTIIAEEPDDEELYYYVDWGDGSNSNWLGPFLSNEEHILSHTWLSKDSYLVKFKAKDRWGIESEWKSIRLTVGRTSSRIQNENIFNDLVFRFPLIKNLYKILSHNFFDLVRLDCMLNFH
jgi:hypothetical protein